jgi:hypothetical protein
VGISKQKRCARHGKKVESDSKPGWYWCRQCQADLNTKNQKKDETPPSLPTITAATKHKSNKLSNEELFQQTLIEQVKLCSHPNPRIRLVATSKVQTLLGKLGIGSGATVEDMADIEARKMALESVAHDPIYAATLSVTMLESHVWPMPQGYRLYRGDALVAGDGTQIELAEPEAAPLLLDEPVKPVIEDAVVVGREPCACHDPYAVHESGGECQGSDLAGCRRGCRLYAPISESERS